MRARFSIALFLLLSSFPLASAGGTTEAKLAKAPPRQGDRAMKDSLETLRLYLPEVGQ